MKAKLPAHSEIAVPLLDAIQKADGLSAKGAAAAVADKLGLRPDIRECRDTLPNGESVNLWQRRVRWVKQSLIAEGLIASPRFNWWEATEKSKEFLRNCRPGIIVTVFETENGQALWAEAETAAAHIRDNSIDLILTSPEYPLVRPKHYGNRVGDDYIDWLSGLARVWKPKIRESGSLVINLQDVYHKGAPTLQLYQEKLVIRLVECVFRRKPDRVPT